MNLIQNTGRRILQDADDLGRSDPVEQRSALVSDAAVHRIPARPQPDARSERSHPRELQRSGTNNIKHFCNN